MSILVDDDLPINSTHPFFVTIHFLLQRAKTKPDLNPLGLTRAEGVKQGRRKKQGESAFDHHMNMLRTYKEVHGHLKMRQRYCIPWDNHFLPHMWGENLGSVVRRIRGGRIHADKREELEALGFDFLKQVNPLMLGFPVLKQSLEKYKAVYYPDITEGQLWTVSQRFMVPTDDPAWPEEVRGKRLGAFVDKIRNRGYYKENQEELETMGLDLSKQERFNLSALNAIGWDVVEQCLVQYMELNPETTKEKGWTVPRDFHVPSGDPAWPEAAWGKNLGAIVLHIRINGTYKKHRAAVEAQGIVIYNK